MQLTIPVKGKSMTVDPDQASYDAEVLAMGHAFVVRFGDKAVLAMVPADQSASSTVIFEMPIEVYHLFAVTDNDEKAYETPNGTKVTAEVVKDEPTNQVPQGKPPLTRPGTPEEAADYIRHWKDRGWPKPSGAIYKLRDKNNSANNAAERVVANLGQREPRKASAKAS